MHFYVELIGIQGYTSLKLHHENASRSRMCIFLTYFQSTMNFQPPKNVNVKT